MHQAGFVVPKFGLEALGLKNLEQRLLEPPGSRALRGGDPPPRGRGGRGRRACGAHRRPHRPLAQRQVHRRGFREQGPHRLGQDQQADLAGALPRALQSHDRLRPAPRPVRARLLGRRRSRRIASACAWSPRRRGTTSSPATCSCGPKPEELEGFKPDFTILNLPGFQADPALDGTASDCAILVNFTERVVAICGTWYAGEIKKSVFTILNYLLPDKNVLPMHASANIGPKGDVAIFFGLSGTGKTTLSADPSRTLIGDDEHGWAEDQPLQLRGRLLRQGDQALAARPSPRSMPPPSASARCWRMS